MNTSCTATRENVRQLYRVRTNHLTHNNYPNLILLSTIHRIDELVRTGIPLVVLDIGIQDIWLPASTVMVHLDPEEIDVSEVMT